MKAEFDELLIDVLRREGGYVNDPADRGGATNKGITQRTYDVWRRDHAQRLRSVQEIDDAEVARIYFRNYWSAARCQEVPREVRDVHFDAAVNHGPGRATKLLQQAAGIYADGLFGPATIKAISGAEPMTLRANYIDARIQFYDQIARRDPTQTRFMAGWMSRMEDFKEATA